MKTKPRLHLYTDFDSTVTIGDCGDNMMAHEYGVEERQRLDRLPETDPENYSLRDAEIAKWSLLKMTIPEAIDVLLGPELHPEHGTPVRPARTPFLSEEEKKGKVDVEVVRSKYRISIDPHFQECYQFCREANIPITIISLGLIPVIKEVLRRVLGPDHGITVRGNDLAFLPEGHWDVQWYDSSPFGIEKGQAMREARANDLANPELDTIFWCGDGSSDFPAALEADAVFAREKSPLERLCKEHSINHTPFKTFATIQQALEQWQQKHA